MSDPVRAVVLALGLAGLIYGLAFSIHLLKKDDTSAQHRALQFGVKP